MVKHAVRRTSVILVGFLLVAALPARSEEPGVRKHALVKELLEVTESTKLAEQVSGTVMQQMQSNYSNIIVQMMSREHKLTDDQTKRLTAQAEESFNRFSKRFRELFLQKVDFGKLTEEVTLPLYEKYFSEVELKDLIAFYKTQTGKKTLSVMPQLMGESMQRTAQMLNPVIMQLIQQVMDEEKARLCKDTNIC